MSQQDLSTHFSPLRYEDGKLELIDQLALPNAERWVTCNSSREVAKAIVKMIVRGAPAIGCAAAYGVAIASRALPPNDQFVAGSLDSDFAELAETRPTAVNLFWALEQMRRVVAENAQQKNVELAEKLEESARRIHSDDIAMCRRIGEHGATLIPDGATVLTHCNTGALATGGYGTALGVIRAAREAGKNIKILANETRPYLQGARLTAWELNREGFDVTVIPDSAAAFLIQQKQVSLAIVGADRIAANGDTANKIGTYGVALACRAANIPFYVAAPLSTIDLKTKAGTAIVIEERGGKEMTHIGETRLTPEGVKVRYPAFDVTPAALISRIITDAAVAQDPYTTSIANLF